jgi:hypothetical protein
MRRHSVKIKKEPENMPEECSMCASLGVCHDDIVFFISEFNVSTLEG